MSKFSKSYTHPFVEHFLVFKETTTRKDALRFQSDTNSLGMWSKICLLTFYLEKSWNLEQILQHIIYAKIRFWQPRASGKDLGVFLDTDLKFEEHIFIKIIKVQPNGWLHIKRHIAYKKHVKSISTQLKTHSVALLNFRMDIKTWTIQKD